MPLKMPSSIFIYKYTITYAICPVQWRHNGHDGVSNHQPRDCLSTVYSGADQRKYQSSASLSFVREFTGDRWISRTNGQYLGKLFLLMTSLYHCETRACWLDLSWRFLRNYVSYPSSIFHYWYVNILWFIAYCSIWNDDLVGVSK